MEHFTTGGFWGLFSSKASDIYPGRYSPEECARLAELADQALELLRQRDTLLLVHNYQLPELQEIGRAAGYIGDSYGLTLKAKQTHHRTIVFCSVEFMAKTAKILLPDRRVLTPARAGCSLVASVSLPTVRRWKEKHSDGKVVSYINTDDLTKAGKRLHLHFAQRFGRRRPRSKGVSPIPHSLPAGPIPGSSRHAGTRNRSGRYACVGRRLPRPPENRRRRH